MRSALSVAVMAVSVCVVSRPVSATTDYDGLLRLVPQDANALVLINAQGIESSGYAKAQHMAEQRTMRAADKTLEVPLGATQFARGAMIDLTTGTPRWEVTAVRFQNPVTADGIAKAEGGHTDRLGELDAVFSPRDFVAVVFADKLVGAYAPADRQTAVRWAKTANTALGANLSPYLASAVAAADMEKTQLMLAIELAGVVAPHDILPRLAQSELVKQANLDPSAVANLIASIQGMMLSVSFTDTADGAISLHFDQDAAMLAPVAKQAVVNAFAARGAYIAELEDWNPKVEGKTVTLSGPLYTSGLRRIASLLSAPAPDTKADVEEASAEELDPASASQRHFKAVQSIINDVLKAENADQISDIAVYLDRYARKIDQLPILNVDKELVAWSGYVSSSLRGASQRLKDVRLNTAARAAEHSNFYDTQDTGGAPTRTVAVTSSGRTYGHSYYDGDSNYRYGDYRNTELHEVEYDVERYRQKYQERERRSIALEERAQGKQEALKIIQDLENSINDIRGKMTEKYHVEF